MERQVYVTKNEKGYITLLSALILVAVSYVVIGALLLLGIGISSTSLDIGRAKQSRALADFCAEEALEQIREDINFTGTGNISVGSGSCNYEVINLGAKDREIHSEGIYGGAYNRILIFLDQENPTINVLSWSEVVSF